MDLKLTLALERSEAVRGESVRFVATLTNAGKAPVAVPAPIPRNEVLVVHATAADGTKFTGGATRYQHVEGTPHPHVRQKDAVTLAPGQSVQVRGDLLVWLGEIPVGGYAVTAEYFNANIVQVPSEPVKLTVVEPKAVFLAAAPAQAVRERAERLFSWINESARGREVFLLATSARRPTVSLYNRRLGPVTVASGVLPAASHLVPPSPAHAAWVTGGKLHFVRMTIDGPDERVTAVPLPEEDLAPVAPPYTTPEGEIAVLLVNAEGDSAGLLRAAAVGAARFTKVPLRPALSGGPRGLCWAEDGRFALLWVDDEELQVHGVIGRVEGPAGQLTARGVHAAPHEVMDVRPFMHYDSERGAYDVLACILCRDKTLDVWRRQVVMVDGPGGPRVLDDAQKVVTPMGPSIGGPRVLQSELRPVFDGLPKAYYLVAGSDEKVHVLGPELGAPVPVEHFPGQGVTRRDMPQLVGSAAGSDYRGMYVRYVRDGKMEVKKVAE